MFNKNHVFLGLVAILGIWLVLKMTGDFVDHVDADERFVRMEIFEQRKPIENLFQERKTRKKRELYIDRIDFAPGNVLKHEKIGVLPFSENFFADFEAEFDVLKAGKYEFTVISDDGFQLVIDGKELSVFPVNRGFEATRSIIFLDEGIHHLSLSYYQGYGPLGLKVTYRLVHRGRTYVIGDSSSYIRFNLMDEEQ